MWEIDGETNKDWRKHIDPPFTAWDFLSLTLYFVGLGTTGGLWPEHLQTIAQVIEWLETISDVAELAQGLIAPKDAGEAKEYHLRFSFDASAGYHQVGVGLRANAAAVALGYSCSVMAGMVEEIEVTFPKTVITENTVWDEDKFIENPVFVESGAKLTISPGHSVDVADIQQVASR